MLCIFVIHAKVNELYFHYLSVSYFLHLNFVNKLTSVLLLTLVIANIASFSYIPISAEAYTSHTNKTKNDSTVIGKGSFATYTSHTNKTKNDGTGVGMGPFTAYTSHTNKTKNDSTGIGKGSSEDKKYLQSLKSKQHGRSHGIACIQQKNCKFQIFVR